jgi:ElaB/YqjD/DUF883 family membrane-anchored ribosome-binding protein
METYFPAMENSQSQVARERVMADLKALVGDAETLLRATANDASEKAREARARLSAAVEKAKTTCADLQQQGLAAAKQAGQRIDDTIRDHPYEAIGVALGVGVLLGALLRRR